MCTCGIHITIIQNYNIHLKTYILVGLYSVTQWDKYTKAGKYMTVSTRNILRNMIQMNTKDERGMMWYHQHRTKKTPTPHLILRLWYTIESEWKQHAKLSLIV